MVTRGAYSLFSACKEFTVRVKTEKVVEIMLCAGAVRGGSRAVTGDSEGGSNHRLLPGLTGTAGNTGVR